MSYGFMEIDHLLASGDPQIGGAQYERLGFTVTPISVIENLGVANRLILMKPLTAGTANFFECMGITNPVRAARNPMGALLAGAPGVRSMVLSGADALGSYESLARDGFPFARPLDIEREWTLPDGEVLKPAFRVTLPVGEPLRFNFCQYRTLQHYVREAWLKHENGALHMTKVFAIAADPAAVCRYYERVFGRAAHREHDLYAVGPGKCELHVGNGSQLANVLPAHWIPANAGAGRYVGFEVQFGSLEAVRGLLIARGVEFLEEREALVVAPHEACGNVLRFVEHGGPHIPLFRRAL